jgi:L,D-transpeptidase ErfK/SrfK
LVGEIRHHTALYTDTLLDLARDNNLGYVELIAANPGVDPWIPGAGKRIVLPTAHLLPAGPREGILLNLTDQRLYYFPPEGGPVQSYAIGTGQEAWDTPTGSTKLVRKKRNPTWHVPKSIRKENPELPAIVRPGPDNPLGRHALYLGWSSYLIHGTNSPWGVGRRVSHGCIRMYPEGIAKLFPKLPIGTPVTVVQQELKLGWHNDTLFMEVHPNPAQQLELEEKREFSPVPVPELIYRVADKAGKARKDVDWDRVNNAVAQRSGLPIPILATS